MADNSTSPPSSTPRPKRRRRWRRRVLIAVVIVVALAWSAPYLISTPPGTALVVWIANSQLRGTIHIDDLSLRWLTRCRVSGLRVTDPAGREVLDIPNIHLGRGVLELALAPETFEQLSVVSPQVVLYVKDGKFSLGDAFKSPAREKSRRKKPPRKKEPSPPEPRGSIDITDANVRIIRPDGQELQLADIDVQLIFQTLDEIAGGVSMDVAGGRLRAEIDAKGLLDGARIRPDKAAGSVAVSTDGHIDLAVLGAFAGRPELGGELTINAEAQLDAGKVTAKFDTVASNVQAGRVGGMQVKPMSVKLTGKLTGADDLYAGELHLARGSDELHANVTYRHDPEKWKHLRPADFLAAVTKGEPLDLPDFEATTSGKLDLVPIAQAIPSLLRIREGTEIATGWLEANNVVIIGGAEPTATGVVQLAALSSRRGEQTRKYDDIVLDFDAAILAGTGLKARQVRLGWGRDELTASGTPEQVQGNYRIDLAAVQQRLAQMLDLGSLKLEGKASGSFDVRFKQNRLDFTSVNLLDDDTGKRSDLRLVGWYDASDESFGVEFRLQPGNLAYLGRLAKSLGHDQISPYAAHVNVVATASRASAKAPILTSGQVTADRLSHKGKVLSEHTLDLRWKELAYDVEAKRVAGKSVKIEGEHVWVLVRDLRANASGEIKPAGTVEVIAHLPWCLEVARSITGRKDLPAGEGRLVATAVIRSDGARTTFDAAATVRPVGEDVALWPTHAPSGPKLLDMTAAGWLDLKARTYQAEMSLNHADLAWAGRGLGPTGAKDLARFTGIARATAKVGQASANAPLRCSGKGSVIDLRIDGKPVGDKDTSFEFAGMEFDRAEKILAIVSTSLVGPGAKLDARDIHCSFGKQFRMDGRVTAAADLREALTVATPLAGWKQTPPVTGRATWEGNFATTGGTVELSGDGRIDDLRINRGDEEAISEKLITFTQQAIVDTQAETVKLRKLNINSELRTADVAGTVSQYRSGAVLDLSGNYRGSWERLTALLHAFRPELKDEVVFTGPAEGKFTVTGPAHRPKIRPSFRGVAAGGQAGWTSATVYGLPLDEATFRPTLREGVFHLPLTTIAAGGGKLRVAAKVDFQTEEPTLTIPGNLTIMENVPINRSLGDNLFSRIFVFLYNAEKLTGQASLRTGADGLTLPLGKGIKTGGAGGGHLDLKDIKIRTRGESLLDMLIELGGLPKTDLAAIKISGLDFEIREGRVRYDNCTVWIADVYDVKLSGSVGFDDSLEMTVSLPITPALLEKLGIKLGGGGLGRVLKRVRRVPIFIGGTRQKPKLDFSKVDIRKILTSLPDILGPLLGPDGDGGEDPLRDLLDDLLKGKDEPASQPASGPASRPKPKTPEETIFDLLDLLTRPRDKPPAE